MKNPIRKLRQENNFTKGVFNRFADTMVPGTYRLYIDNDKYYWKLCKTEWEYFKAILKLRPKLFTKLLLMKNKATGTSTDGLNDTILMTRKNNCKLFSTREQTVTTVCNDADLPAKALNFSSCYCKFLDSSYVLKTDIAHNTITEKLIENKTGWTADENLYNGYLKWFYRGFSNYIDQIAHVDSYKKPDEIVNEIKNKSKDTDAVLLADDILARLNSYKDTAFPCIDSHNDTVLSNILYDGQNYYLIDYEYYGSNVFFYDLLFGPIWEASEYHRYSHIKMFLNGEFDSVFRNVFEHFNLTFNSEKRFDYILLTILSNIHLHTLTGDGIHSGSFKNILRELQNGR